MVPIQEEAKEQSPWRGTWLSLGPEGHRAPSGDRQRVSLEESGEPAIGFGEGNRRGRFGEGKVPSFPPVCMGGALKPKALTIKEALGFLCHPTRQHDTLAWGGWTEGLRGLVFLAGGSKSRAAAVGEREELQAAEGAVQLALGEEVGREQAPRLRLPILRLEHVILQLLHTLRRLHIPCEGTGRPLGSTSTCSPPPYSAAGGRPGGQILPGNVGCLSASGTLHIPLLGLPRITLLLASSSGPS